MTFAAAHAVMVWQRDTRRVSDLPLAPGHLVQAHVGGEIRQVVAVVSAGEYIERVAQARAREAQTELAAWGRS
jgi:hypothetical protein